MILNTAIIYILIEVVKRTGYISKNLLPLVAIVVGALFGFATIGTLQGILEGVAYGGLCVGIYEGQKNLRKKE